MGKSKIFKSKTFSYAGNKVAIYGNNICDWRVTFSRPDGRTEYQAAEKWADVLKFIHQQADTIKAAIELKLKVCKYYRQMAVYEASCESYSENEVKNNPRYTDEEKNQMLTIIGNRRKRIMDIFCVEEKELVPEYDYLYEHYLRG